MAEIQDKQTTEKDCLSNTDKDSTVDIIQRNKALIRSINTNPKNAVDYANNLTVFLSIMGFKSLRPNQVDAVSHLFTGQDLLFVSNTGGGKSAVYASAAICMHLRTIIFSPLVSLIQDQADGLRRKGFNVGVINSAVTAREKSLALALWESNDLHFLFVAPERLQNVDFLNAMIKTPPEFVVVDEIHCAYEHGDNFRASYKLIAPFVNAIHPKLFLGLTATMSQEVEEAVRSVFDLKDTKKICRSFNRDNLHYKSYIPRDGESSFLLDNFVLNEVNRKNENGDLVPCIVYCSTAAMVGKLYGMFAKSIPGGAMMYTGDMPPAEKESNQMRFIQGKIRVAFATNAFGMGVDKPDIGKVIFRTIPSSMEELTQGFGRGGRNGCDCDCILVADMYSLNTQKFFIDIGYPSRHTIEAFYRGLNILKDKDNEDNLVYATLSDICGTVGVDPKFSGALTQILQGYKVIKRTNITPEAKVRILDAPDDNDRLRDKFEGYMSKIEYVGSDDGKGNISFDLGFLSKEMGLSQETIKKTLKSYSQLGFISYIPPARSSPLQIIGDISLVDFKHLDKKRLEKENKLNELITYIKTPDLKKAEFIERYFETENG